jgi:hypothetical protein
MLMERLHKRRLIGKGAVEVRDLKEDYVKQETGPGKQIVSINLTRKIFFKGHLADYGCPVFVEWSPRPHV